MGESTAPKKPSYDLSIVIVNYNTHELVRDCLNSLLETHSDLLLQVILVDNASPRKGIATVVEEFKSNFEKAGCELRLIESDKNLGFTGGNNLGFEYATAPTLLLLNSDTVMHEGALQQCLDYLSAHPDVGILGPKLLNEDGSHQMSCRRFPSFETALFNRYSLLTRWFPSNPWSKHYLMPDAATSEEPFEVDWVSGAALFITREAFEAVGPLDNSFYMYAEDVDWCKRVREADYSVAYLPAAQITHLIGQSSKQLPIRTIYWRHRAMWRFYAKHISRRVALIDWITLCGIMARCLMKCAANLPRKTRAA